MCHFPIQYPGSGMVLDCINYCSLPASLLLFSFPYMYIPFISGISLTWFDSSSMLMMNKYGDKG